MTWPCCLTRHQSDYTRTTQALPGGSRSQPVAAGSLARKFLLQPVIPGGRRLCQLSLYRPVTPEVAGSSPVAPVKALQIDIFCCLFRRKRPPASFHPAHIPHGNSRL